MLNTCNTVCTSNNKIVNFENLTARGGNVPKYKVVEHYTINKSSVLIQHYDEDSDQNIDSKINRKFFETRNV